MASSIEGRRILVVEDQYLLAQELTRHLRQWGAEVIGPVPSRELALHAIANAGPIDFALLDVNLNGKTVYPVAELLEAQGTPFMFVTGYGHEVIRSDFADAPYLDKPVAIARLLPILESLAKSKPRERSWH